MKKRFILESILDATISLYAGFVQAANPTPVQENMEMHEQEQIYGSQLMTRQECSEYHARMRAAGTAEEQEQVRDEYHQAMKKGAALQGICVPEDPPVGGIGSGSSNGIGQGGGRGSGKGRRR